MKKLLFNSIILVLLLSGCEKLEVINENPNNVSETHPQLLLTKIEWDAFQVAGVGPMFASRMVVQTDGENSSQYYKWDRGSYGSYDRLRDITKMIEEAQRIESPSYEALGKFFRAYYFYNLTLTFGDIPYFEALKGESEQVFTPVYDTQKAVFIGILNELDDASALLTDDIIDGDIIYNGNPDKWRKLINSYKLRILLSLSKKEGDADLNVKSRFAAVVASETLLESNEDNGQLEFVDQLGSRYTEYNDSGYGSARYMDSTFIQKLKDRSDPRLFIYADQTRQAKEDGLAIDDFDSYDGGNPVAPYEQVNEKAAAGLVSKPNLRYTTNPTTEPHMILGYSELQLILAEAVVRGWISGNAKTYYENGVKASFGFYNQFAGSFASFVDAVAANAYLSNGMVDFDQASTDEEKIEFIVTQKYLQSFLQGGWRPFYEKLRTGYPDFLEPQGSSIPSRWIYPTSAYQLNADNVSAAIARQFGEGNDDIRETPWWLE
jgi:hypothetical protein